jgi:hypothetical protein
MQRFNIASRRRVCIIGCSEAVGVPSRVVAFAAFVEREARAVRVRVPCVEVLSFLFWPPRVIAAFEIGVAAFFWAEWVPHEVVSWAAFMLAVAWACRVPHPVVAWAAEHLIVAHLPDHVECQVEAMSACFGCVK